MQIPQRKNRTMVLKEINRILNLKNSSQHMTVIKTKITWTSGSKRKCWCVGKQDERLYEFGDIIISVKTLQEDPYLHIPTNFKYLSAWRKQGLQSSKAFIEVNHISWKRWCQRFLFRLPLLDRQKIRKGFFIQKKIQSDISLWIFCIKKLVLVLFWKEGWIDLPI